MNAARGTDRWMFAILCALAMSIALGQLYWTRAQLSESEEFFDDGEQEFEQQAETLEDPQRSKGTPLLTVDEEPVGSEVEPSEESSGENLLPTTDNPGNVE